MSNKHLDEDQIAVCVVDGAAHSDEVREHLKTCQPCRARKQALEDGLLRLGQMSKKFVEPPPREAFRLKKDTARRHHWSWRFGLPLGAALTAALILMLWLAPSGSPPRNHEATITYENPGSHGRLMIELDILAENPFSQFHTFVIGESSSGFDEDFLEFVIPVSEET